MKVELSNGEGWYSNWKAMEKRFLRLTHGEGRRLRELYPFYKQERSKGRVDQRMGKESGKWSIQVISSESYL